MKEFELNSDTIAGKNVLEASAGTGKTFTIAGLYLRLLLEQGMNVDKILVVTFTEAATAELTTRIRETLKTALHAFTAAAGGTFVPDEYDDPIPSLVDAIDATAAIERLAINLHSFDEASIYTIHGFCRTLLLENSFESGTQFGCDLETDQQSLIEGVVADYWRQTLATATPLLVQKMTDPKAGLGIGALTRIVKQAMDHLDVEIIPAPPKSSTKKLYTRYAGLFEKAKSAWTKKGEKLVDLLAGNAQLNLATYKTEKVRAKAALVDVYFSQSDDPGQVPKELEIFTQAKLSGSVKKGCTAPADPFFALCDELSAASAEVEQAVAADVLAVQLNAFTYVSTHLADRKRELNILSFNDLLLTTRDAVCSPGAGALIEKLRGRYSAVLIDEFQDTDPVQYTIFSRLFGDGTTVLFYIGDPKQAIYGFRGADVFAYMAATKEKGVRKATLAKNFRSTRGLIHAVNTLFTQARDPFIFDGIEFSPVSFPEEQQQGRLIIEGEEPPPMTIAYSPYVRPADDHKSGEALNKARSVDLVLELAADEVVRLLSLGRKGTAYFEKAGVRETLDENSVAVLVRTNVQARRMQEALLEAGVHSVIHSNESIFASREAGEVLRVMTAAAEPASARLLRSALITSLFGVTAEELDALNTDTMLMGRRHEQFLLLNAQWKRNGFVEMFSRVVEQEDVLSRLLLLPEGERRAANLLQLTELLQKAESDEQLSPLALVKWLGQRIASGDKEDEEYVENLATDQKAVKIVTVHSSKGLQYKIVLCPFLWEVTMPSANTPKPAVFFHEEARGAGTHRLVYDIGSERLAENTAVFERETLAEQSRLAYVALTRAEYLCTVLYGNFSSTERSALGYLLHRTSDPAALSAVLADERRVMGDLKRLAAAGKGTIRIQTAGEPQGLSLEPVDATTPRDGTIVLRPRKRTIDTAATVASFTSLAQHTGRGRRQSYIDEVQGGEDGERSALEKSIFTFAKGKLAGDFFHEVLEKVRFDMSDADTVIAARMKKYGLDESEEPVARETVRNVLEKELVQVAPGFSLSQLGEAERRHETNFYFPLTPFARRQLRTFMDEYTQAPGGAPRDDVQDGRVKGWLNGKIDLLFTHGGKYYLVDWKSNYLGGTREAYEPERLREAMADDDYFLQELLYIIATDRYLSDRLPGYTYDMHFGGVFYLFLRGISSSAADQCGIFFEKPDAALIRRLAALIAAPMPRDTQTTNDNDNE